MEGIVPVVSRRAKQRLQQNLKLCRDADLRARYLIIVNLLDGRSVSDTSRAVGVARCTVYRVAARFRESGEAGLIDRREDNGDPKLDERYLAELYGVVASSPWDYGWRRPTWTREMLVETLDELTGVRVSLASMSRALKQIGARWGRPRPTVGCPWSKSAKTRRLRQIRRLVEQRAPDEVVVYADEVDIHLNPKIGPDWMVPGQQKEVPTPGQNEKRYLAGAQDSHSGELIWAEGDRKDSSLFIALLWALWRYYPRAKVIHVIVDNCRVHKSRHTELALASTDGRIRLHFLPPYCPNDNKIERTWQTLHAEVTRNHRCPDMESLMDDVRDYLDTHNEFVRAFHAQQSSHAHSERVSVSQFCTVI